MTGTPNTGTPNAGTPDPGVIETGTTTEPVPAPASSHLEGRGYTVGGFIMAVLAIAVIPPLHGIIGAILGYIGYRKGDPLGRTAAVCSLVAMVVGGVIAAFAFNSVT